jgi:hypothetical protein
MFEAGELSKPYEKYVGQFCKPDYGVVNRICFIAPTGRDSMPLFIVDLRKKRIEKVFASMKFDEITPHPMDYHVVISTIFEKANEAHFNG